MEPQHEENINNNNNNINKDESKEKEEANRNLLEKYEQDKLSNNKEDDQLKEIEQKKREFVRDERNDSGAVGTGNNNQQDNNKQNIQQDIQQENHQHDNQNENRIEELNDDEINDFEEKSPNEWSNDDVKSWIQYKKSLGTDRDKGAHTEEFEKRNGRSLLEIAKSKDTFRLYSGDSDYDKSFSSALFDDLKERFDIFYRKNLIKSIVNKIVQIRIIRKRVLWQAEICYSIGLRVGGSLILTSNDHLNNFNEKTTTIEIGISNKWYRGSLLEITDPFQSIDCALIRTNELDENEMCDTFPILKRPYTLNSEVFYFDLPISRLPINASCKDKNFKDIKPLEPSIFTARISFFDDNNLEVHLNGSDNNEFDNKSRLIFTCKNGELCGIIKKKSQHHQYLNTNVLYCTKASTINAWVNTTLKKLQNPPLWE